jgi:GNAT superfamily N-acetyltransferase
VQRDELLAAGDRNLAAVLRLAARSAPKGTLEDDGRLVLVSASATWPGPYHNGALRLDPTMEPVEVLGRAQAFFSGRCPGYCVWIAAHADADLEEEARAAGLPSVSVDGAPRMALDGPLPAAEAMPGVDLREVALDNDRRAYVAVTAEAYAETGLPPQVVDEQLAQMAALRGPGVRAVVAWEGDRPLAAALVVVSDGVAGIQLVGTIPAARGRGLGGLCTRWAVDAGLELGAVSSVLEASEAGEPLYRALGFIELSRYRWCFGPPSAGPR